MRPVKKNQTRQVVMNNPEAVFLKKETLAELFPSSRSNDFFEALFGDAEEGAYDIALRYSGFSAEEKRLIFFLDLHERPGKCLACNLTYGLPEVFSRHPVVNIKGLVEDIVQLLGPDVSVKKWQLGTTSQEENSRHCIPLDIDLVEK